LKPEQRVRFPAILPPKREACIRGWQPGWPLRQLRIQLFRGLQGGVPGVVKFAGMGLLGFLT
jgi:hypothetical protein